MKLRKPKKKRASEVASYLLQNHKYSLSYYICSGFKELVEAIQALAKLDFTEFKLEVQQLIFGVEMLYHQYTGYDFELFWCGDVIAEYYARRIIWLDIFKDYELEFKVDYMVNGTNFRRPWKIKEALKLAGKEISLCTAGELSRKYSLRLSRAKSMGLLG